MSSLASLSSSVSTPQGSTPVVSAVVFFVVVFSLVWVLMYSFQPGLICVKDADNTIISGEDGPRIDKGKCVVYSMLVGLLVILGIWASRNVCK
jgi:hypothetical protein